MAIALTLDGCISTCMQCADHCRANAEQCRSYGSPEMDRCADICERCAAHCDECVVMLRIGVADKCSECASWCDACAEECGYHATHHEHCRVTGEIARQCAEECRQGSNSTWAPPIDF